MRAPMFSSVPQHGWARVHVSGHQPCTHASPAHGPWHMQDTLQPSWPYAAAGSGWALASRPKDDCPTPSHEEPPMARPNSMQQCKPRSEKERNASPSGHASAPHTAIAICISPSPTKARPSAPIDWQGSVQTAAAVGGCAHGQGGYDGVQGAMRYGEVTRSVYVVAMVYGERLRQAKARGHPLGALEAGGQWCGQCERVGLLVLGCKYVEDVPWPNSRWAVWAGMALARLNHVEAALLKALGYALAVAPADFDACASAYMAALHKCALPPVLQGHQSPSVPASPAPAYPTLAAAASTRPPHRAQPVRSQCTPQGAMPWATARTAKFMGPQGTWV